MMKIWSLILLEQIPQLWKADIKALNDHNITTAQNLIQAVKDDGLNNLSDSTGIPWDALNTYVDAVEALVARQKTLRFASAISSVAIAVVIGLSTLMLVVQADLPPLPAEEEYADLHSTYSQTSMEAADVLPEVNELLKTFERESADDNSAASTVNLRLLAAALEDHIALERLEDIANDSRAADFSESYKKYTESFERARKLHGSIEASDPRITFARVNSARAWTNRSATLNIILPSLGENEANNIRDDIHHAQDQAQEQVSLARTAPGLPSQHLNQTVENVAIELNNQTTQNYTVQLELQITALLQRQQKSIMDEVNVEHEKTRELIRDLAMALGSPLPDPIVDAVNSEDEPTSEQIGNGLVAALGNSQLTQPSGDPEVEIPSSLNLDDQTIDPTWTGDCGFINRDLATQRLGTLCIGQELDEPVSFIVTVAKTSGGDPTISAQGPSTHSLSCNVEEVLEDFSFHDGEHNCRLRFEVE